MLLEAIRDHAVDGVRVLLKHGAQRDLASWGDCMPRTPLETAQNKPEILALLQASELPDYIRKTDPPLPQSESPEEQAVNRQGEIREKTGLVFQTTALKRPD
jgi:hypothetical protein